MGMDIYFHPENKHGEALRETVNFRCREVYHLFNDWCELHGRPTPESGERVSLTSAQWKELEPKFLDIMASAIQETSGCSQELAMDDAKVWRDSIHPPGTVTVKYWFTN